jgi:parallel beta-helix repeat protein
MPTIDDLPAAVSVSDGDELIVSQSDVARKATRAQMLSGVQPALAIASGTLLGRLSPGIGAPESIALGANLTIGNGALSAPAPFVIAGLTNGGAPAAADQVPIAQGGQNAQIAYAAFLSGLSALPGISGSNLTAVANGGTYTRPIADYLGDALSIESFGAAGDGITDDTDAFIAALATGRPLRLDGRVYIVNGALNFAVTAAVLGVPGSTVIRRATLVSPTSWISVTSPAFQATGVIFDAGALTGADMPAVAVGLACLSATFTACSFINAVGPTQGSGLSVSVATGAVCQLVQCGFESNGLHGVDAAGTGILTTDGCVAAGNGGCGIRVEAGVGCAIRTCQCTANSLGVSIGNWGTGAAPQQLGPSCVVAENICNGNSDWGIAIAAGGALVTGNTMQGNGTVMPGGGLLARLAASRVGDNIITQGATGIDARGCWGSLLTGNHVSNASTGISAGGSQNMDISGNTLLTNVWALHVSAIEPALSNVPTGPLSITSNWIGFTTAQGGGIAVLDAAQGIAIVGNDINGWGSAIVNQAIWLHSDAAILRDNRWNNQSQYAVQANPVAGLQALVVPDVADDVLVTSAAAPIASVLTNHQADTLGEVLYVKVTNGGAGYTQAQVALSGSGAGAAAAAIIANGQVVWIVVTNAGSGYGPIGSAVNVSILGDGTGALATACAGLPVIEGRRVRLNCNCQVQLSLSGSSPAQQSWTEYASTIPAFGAAELEGVFGGWHAVSFPPVDYLAPTGNGGVVLQSVGGGNVVLRPASGGALHLASGTEAVGCTSSVGRGSPLGSVAAPPGSDFRNLNGGAGNTFWIKQENSDATGWIAVA